MNKFAANADRTNGEVLMRLRLELVFILMILFVGAPAMAGDFPSIQQALDFLRSVSKGELPKYDQCTRNLAGAGIQLQDQCEFIRAGIDALPATGGTVKIPQGNYTCNEPIVLGRSHISLIGIGKVSIRLADHANAPLIVLGSTLTPPPMVEDVAVENLQLDGNKDMQDGECWGGACDTGKYTFIRNNGITIRGVINGRVENVSITAARSGGLVSERNSRNLRINNLSSTNNFFDGLAGCQTTDSTFLNLTLSNNHNAGISLDLNFSGNTFSNVKILNNKDVGIFMRYANSNHFNSVEIKSPGSFGVFLSKSELQNSCTSGNEFHNLSVIDAPRAAFRLNSNCADNKLTGNTIFANDKGCISEAQGAKLNVAGQVICD